MVQKKLMNDKTELVKKAKNDKARRCCWSAYQKKIRQNGIRRNAIQPRLHLCLLYDAGLQLKVVKDSKPVNAECEYLGTGLAPCSPIDSIITLMSVWRRTGKIIRTTIMLITYARV